VLVLEPEEARKESKGSINT